MSAVKKAPTEVTATGYRTEESLFATRYTQGGRPVYLLALTPDQIINLVGRPDPDAATLGNRRITPQHAKDFSNYFIAQEKWVSPGIILRAPDIFSFEETQDAGTAKFGLMKYPKRAQIEIHILDGQHRILGFHEANDTLRDALDRARSQRVDAMRVDPGGAGFLEAERRIREIELQRDRFMQESVAVEIQITDDPVEYKQIFFDVADNQKGITGSVKAHFDSRKVVNRALPFVLEHHLLVNRVDMEQDRIGRGSPYLMGANNVAEITKAVFVGLDGRVSKNQEASSTEEGVAEEAKDFLDVLVESFPPISAIAYGQITPELLRRTSKLGSVLMVRILASIYHDLKEKHAFSRDMIVDYFTKLAPFMEGPADELSIWINEAPAGTFDVDAMAPSGRRQDYKALKAAMLSWAILRPKFLEEEVRKARIIEEDVDPEYGIGYTSVGADIPKTK